MSLAGGQGAASQQFDNVGGFSGGGGGGGYAGGGGGGAGEGGAGGGGGGSSYGVGPGLSNEMTATGAASVTISYSTSNVPTSKNQCKNGGWQNLADNNGTPFKNQGDCVSYVATGGKNLATG